MVRSITWCLLAGFGLILVGALIASNKGAFDATVDVWRALPWLTDAGWAIGILIAAGGVSALLAEVLRMFTGRAPIHVAIDGDSTAVILDQTQTAAMALLKRPQPEISAVLDVILEGAAAASASDVHITPEALSCRVTLRIDGTLFPLVEVGALEGRSLVNRVKVLARLRLERRTGPQDGRLSRTVAGVQLDIRVSALPTEAGDRVVLRLVAGSVDLPRLSELGFGPRVAEGLAAVLDRAQGLLFVTGPVGSGKSTTLYAALQHIDRARGAQTCMVSLEDPIEHRLSFLTQTQIDHDAGLSFAHTLRSVLRQDPNVLMVGEIRDAETARVAVQAGLSGHLILTTVHASDAAGAFTRLVDMGVEPRTLAGASVGSLSQRLVRQLCPACRVVEPPAAETRQRFEKLGVSLPEGEYCTATGCVRCDEQGYKGRLPIAELLLVDESIRRAIGERADPRELSRLATSQGMLSLVSEGVTLAALGKTTLAEVLRVAGGDA